MVVERVGAATRKPDATLYAIPVEVCRDRARSRKQDVDERHRRACESRALADHDVAYGLDPACCEALEELEACAVEGHRNAGHARAEVLERSCESRARRCHRDE